MSLLDFGLSGLGFTEDEIAKIEAAKPQLDFVLSWVKNHKTVLNNLIDVGQMIARRINQK